MTASLNRVQLIGNLGNDPKIVTTKEGKTFVTTTLATNESFKQDDEWQQRVEWHQLVLFGNQTKVAEYLHKGSLVFIEGKLRTNQWTDNEGQSRQTISIVVSNIQLLGQNKKEPADVAQSNIAKMRDLLQEDIEL